MTDVQAFPLGLRQRRRNENTGSESADETLLRDVQRLQQDQSQIHEHNMDQIAVRSPTSMNTSIRNADHGTERNQSRRPVRNYSANRYFRRNVHQLAYWKLPGLYSLISTILAAIAILTSPQKPHYSSNSDSKFGFLWKPLNLTESFRKTAVGKDPIMDEKMASRTLDGNVFGSGSPSSNIVVSAGESSDSKVTSSSQNSSTGFTFLLEWIVECIRHFEVKISSRNSSNDVVQTTGTVSSGWKLDVGSKKTKNEINVKLPIINNLVDAIFPSSLETPMTTRDGKNGNGNNYGDNNRWSKSSFPFNFFSLGSFGNDFTKTDTNKSQGSSWWLEIIDPILLNPNETTLTDLVDKILTSTPRLLAIANLFMALTFLLHQAVAEWFLGTPPAQMRSLDDIIVQSVQYHQRRSQLGSTHWDSIQTSPSSGYSGGRERLLGFLVFKLLLISAVVETPTFDMLILLSWYTLLCFLRSLVSLCAQSTARTTASVNSANASAREQISTRQGQAQQATLPHPGVLRLLGTVFVWNLMAVAVCVGLFHDAGVGMVVLLTCDCAVLALHICCHVLRHRLALMESQLLIATRLLEDELNMDGNTNAVRRYESDFLGDDVSQHVSDSDRLDMSNIKSNEESNMNSTDLQSSIERRMEFLDYMHVRNANAIESTIYTILLVSQILTIFHFCHIWSLHGIQLTLVDGVLALQLHSAVATASHSISERRSLQRMETTMKNQFNDATVMDLRKAELSGDVCSICRGTMSVLDDGMVGTIWSKSPLIQAITRGSAKDLNLVPFGICNKFHSDSSSRCSHVKKLSCGHLYHTACLREVVKRAKSLECETCPLCRKPLVIEKEDLETRVAHSTVEPGEATHIIINGSSIPPNQNVTPGTGSNIHATPLANPNDTNNRPPVVEVVHRGADQHDALFRFSTEGMFPAWLPLPAISFEVVRRVSPPLLTDVQGVTERIDDNARRNENSVIFVDDDNNGDIPGGIVPTLQATRAPESWFHRAFSAIGIAPQTMTNEAEHLVVEQLTEIFPHLDR